MKVWGVAAAVLVGLSAVVVGWSLFLMPFKGTLAATMFRCPSESWEAQASEIVSDLSERPARVVGEGDCSGLPWVSSRLSSVEMASSQMAELCSEFEARARVQGWEIRYRGDEGGSRVYGECGYLLEKRVERFGPNLDSYNIELSLSSRKRGTFLDGPVEWSAKPLI